MSGSDADAVELADELERLSRRLHERIRSRSEPDVIIAWPRLLVIAEAKLGSANDRKPATHPGWPLYYSSNYFRVSSEDLKQSGLYELVRNWRIGCELAGARKFVLISLAPKPLDTDAWTLRTVIRATAERQFITRTWSEVLEGSREEIREHAHSRRAIE